MTRKFRRPALWGCVAAGACLAAADDPKPSAAAKDAAAPNAAVPEASTAKVPAEAAPAKPAAERDAKASKATPGAVSVPPLPPFEVPPAPVAAPAPAPVPAVAAETSACCPMKAAGGCGPKCAQRHSSPVPPPTGGYVRPLLDQQVAAAIPERFAVRLHEWYRNGEQLGPYGRRHLQAIADTVESWPHLVVVESGERRSQDDARRLFLVNALLRVGIADAPLRVVVGYSQAEGLWGFEAANAFQRGHSNNTNGSGGSGGFGGGGSGGSGGSGGFGGGGSGGSGGSGGFGGGGSGGFGGGGFGGSGGGGFGSGFGGAPPLVPLTAPSPGLGVFAR